MSDVDKIRRALCEAMISMEMSKSAIGLSYVSGVMDGVEMASDIVMGILEEGDKIKSLVEIPKTPGPISSNKYGDKYGDKE